MKDPVDNIGRENPENKGVRKESLEDRHQFYYPRLKRWLTLTIRSTSQQPNGKKMSQEKGIISIRGRTSLQS